MQIGIRASQLGLLLLLAAGGCGANSAPRRDMEPERRVAPQQAANPNPADGPATAVERKIIYTSQIDVVVDDLDAAQKRLQELVTQVQAAGGYLGRQEISGSKGYQRQSSWTVRVPLAKFDGFVAAVESLGELQRHTREAQDVTDAYADLEARLRNKQASEKRLLSHLDKTGELKDTLEVERELSRVRGEVEQLQGQLNLMKNKTDLATVLITLHERVSYQPPTAPRFSTEISRAFDASIRQLVQFGQALVLLLVILSPWLLVGAIAFFPIRLLLKSRSRRS
ncbi:MAG: DUF4349 domain-containing protein [Planctomycetes bacterium]|nr:DUF4349 domain-containing protein [Planctomycetota bacterium]